MQGKISIIIPVFNEEKHIAATISKVARFVADKNWEHEIIVVEDGSTDATADLLKKFNVRVLRNEKNRGKGFTVKRGVLAASGELILFMDADSSTDITELDKLLFFIDEYDIVIGSRAKTGSKIKKYQPVHKVLL